MLTVQLNNQFLKNQKGVEVKMIEVETEVKLELPLAFQVGQLHSVLHAQAKEIIYRRGNLNLAQWRILRFVSWGSADTTTPVRKASGLAKSLFSKMLGILAKEGYVEVLSYPDDRRQNLIRLAEKGQQAHDKLAPEQDARQQHFLSALTEEERRVISCAIKALTQAERPKDFARPTDNQKDE